MNLKVVEVEWQDAPSYIIVNGERALKLIIDDRPLWTNRWDMAWHNASKPHVEEVISGMLEMEAQRKAEEQERKRVEAWLKR